MSSMDKEITIKVSPRVCIIPDMPDHEGVDEWYAGIFDENGVHSDDLLEVNGQHFVGTFRQCVNVTADFVSKNPNMQCRVVIERVC